MSFKEDSDGHGSVKRGLRRKLTGPPHLLLGKSKTKDDPGSMDKGFNEGSNVLQGSDDRTRQELMDAETLECLDESMAIKEVTETTGMAPSAAQSYQNTFQQRLAALKQAFSPSVCFRCTRKSCGHEDRTYNAVTFFNRQARDSANLSDQVATFNSVSATQAQRCTSPEHRESIKTKKCCLFKRVSPKYISAVKSLSPDDSVHFNARPWPFWRRKPKKPFPFFQECIGDTQEYILEETIVLANKHVDIGEDMAQSQYFKNEFESHCPETQSLMVDVSSLTLELKCATETIMTCDINAIVKPKNIFEGALLTGEDIQVIQLSLADHSGIQTGLNSNQNVDIPCERHHNSPDTGVDTSGYPAETGLLLKTSQQSAAGIGPDPTASSRPGISRIVTSHGAIGECLYTDRSNDMQSRGTEHMTVWSSVPSMLLSGMVHAEENAEQDSEKTEMFLVEVACSVVQTAIKDALDQVRGELMYSVDNLAQL